MGLTKPTFIFIFFDIKNIEMDYNPSGHSYRNVHVGILKSEVKTD